MSDFDVIIIGGGIAGASLACFLSPHAKILILEAEAHVACHSTGRSAAFFSESYGGPVVQPLTIASKDFLFSPPSGFADAPLVRPRGALHIARYDQQDVATNMFNAYAKLSPNLHRIDKAAVDQLAPMLKPEWAISGIFDPDCNDIDVDILHQGYLRQARQHGAKLLTNAPVRGLLREGAHWQVATAQGQFSSAVVVNAAGAWGDRVGALAGLPAIGLTPMQRTIIVFSPSGYPVSPNAPLILDVGETFYFKPDGANIWASPSDETPVLAGDVQPDEITIAIAADRIENATRYHIPSISRRWAGLRTFAPDRAPVFGFDSRAQGFFWCVGQGGFGIQTSAAAAMLCAAQIAGHLIPDTLTQSGVSAARYAIQRFLRT
jgi:D-arginine dehydrogenase